MPPLDIPTYGLVSLGGVTVGLSLFAWDFSRWWTSHPKKRFTVKALRRLAPTLLCLSYGTLLILSAGGLIGAIADWSLWGTNQIGEVVLVYGVGSTSPDVTRSTHLALTPGGHAVIILATVVVLAISSIRGLRWDFARGILAGISLGLASSVAGLAGYILAPVVSTLGDFVAGLLRLVLSLLAGIFYAQLLGRAPHLIYLVPLAWAVTAWQMSDWSATPPPRGVAPGNDVDAARRRAQAKAAYDPNGVLCTYHAPREEVNDK
ncbi:hypothetical protein OG266_39425 [Streptomyces sp. NBC_00554]|uniref:hypothetical protein n=1 Tax=Streptomyces sp. NBC_00554 TaxID=2903661 RepID=UPI00352D7343|nr:hypothetical protein OG266_39425 [Streptomyces sp. NBC_00554]